MEDCQEENQLWLRHLLLDFRTRLLHPRDCPQKRKGTNNEKNIHTNIKVETESSANNLLPLVIIEARSKRNPSTRISVTQYLWPKVCISETNKLFWKCRIYRQLKGKVKYKYNKCTCTVLSRYISWKTKLLITRKTVKRSEWLNAWACHLKTPCMREKKLRRWPQSKAKRVDKLNQQQDAIIWRRQFFFFFFLSIGNKR